MTKIHFYMSIEDRNFSSSIGFTSLRLLLAMMLFLVIGENLQAQPEINDLTTIEKPSPDAYSMGKYGEDNFNMFTGSTTFDVPLYQFKGKELQENITLRYSTGGIPVSQVSSWVGLGWTLQVGGVITREVYGKPDEFSAGFFGPSGYEYWKENIKPIGMYSSFGELSDPEIQTAYNYRSELAFGVRTLQPDRYRFNFGGYSGIIYFAEDGNPYVAPANGIKVIPSYNDEETKEIGSWTLVTPEGVEYTFNETDAERSWYNGTNAYISNWYLSKVKGPTDIEVITYHYLDVGSLQESVNGPHPPSSRKAFATEEVQSTGVCEIKCANIHVDGGVDPTTMEVKYLDQILINRNYASNISINFSSTPDRLDLEYPEAGRRLYQIGVFNSNLHELSRINFENNSYFEPVSNDFPLNTYAYKRLKLNSVKVWDKPDYVFDYYEGHMPSYYSPSVDHEGFQNDANNIDAIPKIPEELQDLYNSISTADRSPGSLESQMKCHLKSIRYPTGLKKTIEYERHKSIVKNVANETISINSSCTENSSSSSQVENGPASPDPHNVGIIQEEFEDTYPEPPIVKITFFQLCEDMMIDVNVAKACETNPDVVAGARLYNAAFLNGKWFVFYGYDVLSSNTQEIFKPEGRYALVTFVVPDGSTPCQISASLTFQECESTITGREIVLPGLRIKSINDFGADVNRTTNYFYKHDYLFGEEIKCGSLVNFKANGQFWHEDYCSEHLKENSFLTDSEGHPLRIMGTHVGYEEVTSIQSVNNVNIATCYRFDAHPNNTRKGKLLEKIEYENNDGIFTPVRTTQNEYAHFPKTEVGGLEFPSVYVNVLSIFCPTSHTAGENQTVVLTLHSFDASRKIQRYSLDGKYLMKSTRVIDHFPSGDIETTTEYDYSPHSLNPTEIKTITNAGTKTTDIKYAHELGNAALINKSMIGIPLEVLNNNGAAGGVKVDYDEYYRPWQYSRSDENGNWQVTKTITEFKNELFPKTVNTLGLTKDMLYDWNYGKLSEMTWHGGTEFWEYNPDDELLDNYQSMNGVETKYYYDLVNRLSKKKERHTTPGEIMYDYSYFFEPEGDKNSRLIENNLEILNSDIEEYYDGTGRGIRTDYKQITPLENDLYRAQYYDELGRVSSEIDPINGASTSYEYYPSPLNRVYKVQEYNWPRARYTMYDSRDGQLEITEIDENENESVIVKDGFNRPVLIERADAITEYKYNERDQITNIKPPGESDWEGPSAYQFIYDEYGRLEQKKIPGQDAWHIYTYYDNDLIETHVDPNGTLTKIEYDGYGREDKTYVDNVLVRDIDYYSEVPGIGQVDQIKTKIIDNSTWLTEKYTYDNFGRLETLEKDYLKGKEKVRYVYFNSNLVHREIYEYSDIENYDGIIKYKYEHSYDEGGRLESTLLYFGDAIFEIADHSYNENTWLITTILGNDLQNVDFSYNTRKWLTAINSLPEDCMHQIIGEYPETDDPATVVSDIIIDFDLEGISSTGSEFEITGEISTSVNNEYFSNQTLNHQFIVGSPNGNSQIEALELNIQGYPTSEMIKEALVDHIENSGFTIHTDFESDLGDKLDDILGRPPGCINEDGDLFSMLINYDELDNDLLNSPNALPQYNGNISRIAWHSCDQNQIDVYDYLYDGLDRLTHADHYGIGLGNIAASNINRYSTSYQYDLRGNIKNLKRYGLLENGTEYGVVDDITLTYDNANNRLSYTSDISPEDFGHLAGSETYDHDLNGNVTVQGDFTIDVNELNLPSLITGEEGSVEFIYDYAGMKHLISQEGEERAYAGNLEIKNGQIESIVHPEGRMVFEDGEFAHLEFYLKDHLGNTRVVFADMNGDNVIDPRAVKDEVRQENHAYPFGLNMNRASFSTNTSPENRYRYNGKELITEIGLDWYDFENRFYDPAIGRFTSVDKLADDRNQVDKSPYAAMWNNPIRYNDPDGNCPWCIGALIGAAADYGLQVAGNLAEGKGLGDALTDVDGGSIATSAALGATGVGLVSKLGKVVKTTDKVVKVTTRTTRAGEKGAKITKQSGKVKDITKNRVKEFDPQPRNPTGKPNQVNFKKNPDRVPKGSKIQKTDPKKRTPTKREIKTLKKSKDIDKT